MQLDPNPSAREASSIGDMRMGNSVPGVTRPGEYIHYYMNLLSIFGGDRTADDIGEMARAATASREKAIDGFSQRLDDLNADFTRQRAESGQQPLRQPKPMMRGWENFPLETMVDAHGGALVALFHFGEHRHVFSDLASLGVPFVAPVAKHAYFDFCELLSTGPEAFSHAMSLIEVEDPKVGRKLFAALREGRVGLIYVDGNMGPDGNLVEEGAVRVEFLGKRIRVKAGIARLAIGLGLPILPLFALRQGGSIEVRFTSPVLAPDKRTLRTESETEAALSDVMEELYSRLAAQVLRAPQQWEFAFCFHRWLDEAEASAAPSFDAEILVASRRLTLDRQRIAEFLRDDEVFWIHVGRQRAFRLPSWAKGFHGCLQSDGASVGESLAFLERSGGTGEQACSLLAELMGQGLLQTTSEAS